LTTVLHAEEYFFFSLEKISTHLVSYDEKEKEDIEKDLQVVRSVCRLNEAPTKEQPLYLASVGASGSRKSTILERFMQAHFDSQPRVYLDSDERALKFMVHTYYAQSLNALQVASHFYYLDVKKMADEKWREASNYITLTLLEEAFQKKADIVHGTTLTEAYVPEFLRKLKSEGYQITLVLCSCDDNVCSEAINYRNQEQRLYKSVLTNSRSFAEKMSDYFTYADTLYLYWSDDVLAEERLAAIFDRGEMIVGEGCACALDAFITKFEEDRNVLLSNSKNIPTWEETIKIYLNRFKR
jgi:predicted ABC-type ATPase